ncbi:MAG: hypothetical protein R2837_07770 [Aliarcobacter sp.]
MSIFITHLAFDSEAVIAAVKLGIFCCFIYSVNLLEYF